MDCEEAMPGAVVAFGILGGAHLKSITEGLASLCTSAEPRVLGELEKDSFIVRQSETQLGFCLENLCVPTPENLLRAFVTVSHRWGL